MRASRTRRSSTLSIFDRPHVLDFIMQGLWIKTQSSPFEAPYFSCVPYLLGEGQAMQYSVWPKSNTKTPIPRLPLRPPDDYLRNAMVAALDQGDVEFDIRVQLQTDPHLMPIENNAVLWPERLSPRDLGGHLAHPDSRSSTRRRRSRSRVASPTTRGTPSPNIARSAIKAVHGAACTSSYRSCGTT